MSTGTCALSSTLLETLPSISLLTPPKPWLPITMISAGHLFASANIWSTGLPLSTFPSLLMPADVSISCPLRTSSSAAWKALSLESLGMMAGGSFASYGFKPAT